MARGNRNKDLHFPPIKSYLPFWGLMLAALALLFIEGPAGQTQSRKRPIAGSTRSAQPKSTPTPSRIEALGTPPPVPLLNTKKEVEVGPGERISVNTTEVMLPVTVRDSAGRLVTNLTRKDFRVFEDNNEQPLSDLAVRKLPVDVILMVDTSSSVVANIDDFRVAAEKFAAQLDPEDRISLIQFDDRVQLLQDWTRSQFQLHRALNRIKAGIFTRFNDALVLAAQEQFGSTQSRRAIIVLSDGMDSGRGVNSLESALQALLTTQVTVYVVSNTKISRAKKLAELDSLSGGSESAVKFNQLRIDDLREGLRALDEGEHRLAKLSEVTGGRLYSPLSFDALGDAYREVADELRMQYAIYYVPLNKTRDGTFRRVRVETTDRVYHTSTRIGYFAPRS
jgi:VWFA-related protein